MSALDSRSRAGTEARDESALAVLIRAVWERLWLVILTAILLAGVVLGYDLVRAPVYEASVMILVGHEEVPNGPEVIEPGGLQGEVEGLALVTQTVIEAAQSRPTAQAVIQRLDLQMSPDDLLENFRVEQVHASQFIQVTYQGSDRDETQLIANTLGDEIAKQALQVNPSANAITATVYESASLPDEPTSPDTLRDVVVALALGGLLGVALAILLEHVGSTWRSPKSSERASSSPDFSFASEIKAPQARSRRRED